MRGTSQPAMDRPAPWAIVRAAGAAFIAIFAIAAPTLYFGLPASAGLFLVGSFGATAVLLYAVPHSELAQPRNVVGGHVLSAFVGVATYKLIGTHLGIAAALAVAVAIAVMLLTRTLHPPAGATALIAVLGPDTVHALGYRYPITPVLIGAVIMVAVAVVFNNLSGDEERHYPLTWH
jgi:CBS domain-containing membrane protein